MTTQHTPGPWTVSRYPATEDTYHHAIFATARDDGRTVTVATVTPISDDGQEGGESNANARAISAVPDLIAALRYIVAWNPRDWNPEKARSLACAALAKAGYGDK